VAIYVGLNVEHFQVDRPSTSIFEGTASLVPDPLNYGWRDYGPRVAIWRLMESLDRHRIRASVLLNSAVCTRYPQIIEAGPSPVVIGRPFRRKYLDQALEYVADHPGVWLTTSDEMAEVRQGRHGAKPGHRVGTRPPIPSPSKGRLGGDDKRAGRGPVARRGK
jgi:hypothetical protein